LRKGQSYWCRSHRASTEIVARRSDLNGGAIPDALKVSFDLQWKGRADSLKRCDNKRAAGIDSPDQSGLRDNSDRRVVHNPNRLRVCFRSIFKGGLRCQLQ
jgi:hypothetical protein